MKSQANYKTALDILAKQINDTLKAHDDGTVWMLVHANVFSCGTVGMSNNPLTNVLLAALAESMSKHTLHEDAAGILEAVASQYRLAKEADPENPMEALYNLTASLLERRNESKDV